MLETLAKVSACDSLPAAGYLLTCFLQEHLQCQRAAIGMPNRGTQKCRLLALSEHAKFDRNSEFVRNVEAALDEAKLRGTLALWPPTEQTDRHATRALQRVSAQISGGGAVLNSSYGEITYSIVAPEDDPRISTDVTESYRYLCHGIVEGLAILGIEAQFKPINDIVVGGRKISGNAQIRRYGAVGST